MQKKQKIENYLILRSPFSPEKVRVYVEIGIIRDTSIFPEKRENGETLTFGFIYQYFFNTKIKKIF